jgi:uncharacterized protein YceK
VKRLLVILMLVLTGCSTVSMMCPSGKSTVSYQGLALFGTTSVACLSSALGDTAQISGLDLAALAAMVAPLIPATAAQKPAVAPAGSN